MLVTAGQILFCLQLRCAALHRIVQMKGNLDMTQNSVSWSNRHKIELTFQYIAKNCTLPYLLWHSDILHGARKILTLLKPYWTTLNRKKLKHKGIFMLNTS